MSSPSAGSANGCAAPPDVDPRLPREDRALALRIALRVAGGPLETKSWRGKSRAVRDLHDQLMQARRRVATLAHATVLFGEGQPKASADRLREALAPKPRGIAGFFESSRAFSEESLWQQTEWRRGWDSNPRYSFEYT